MQRCAGRRARKNMVPPLSVGLTFGPLLLAAGCAGMPSGQGGYSASSAYLPTLSALSQVRGLGPVAAPVVGVMRQQVAAQQAQMRQQAAAQHAAMVRESQPHPAPAPYVGELTPAAGVMGLVNNKTLYLDTAIVANQQVVRMKEDTMFLSSNGKSYSSTWTDKPWHVEGNSICIAGQEAVCMPVFRDGANELFVGADHGMLLKLARLEEGDSSDTKAAYAQNMKNQEQNANMQRAALGLFLGLLASPATGSGSGGGGGCDRQTGDGCSSSQVDQINNDNFLDYSARQNGAH